MLQARAGRVSVWRASGVLDGGALGTLVGLHATIWVGAIGGLVGFVPVLLSPVRSIRTIPAAVQDGPSA